MWASPNAASDELWRGSGYAPLTAHWVKEKTDIIHLASVPKGKSSEETIWLHFPKGGPA